MDEPGGSAAAGGTSWRSSIRPAGAPSGTVSRRAAPAPPSGRARRRSRVRRRCARRVDGDPVTGLARATPEELPGSLRIGRQRALEDVEGEPASLQVGLPEEPIRDVQERGRRIVACGRAEPSLERTEVRRSDPVDGPESGGDAILACPVRTIREGSQAGIQGSREGIGIADPVGEGGADRFCIGLPLGDGCHGPRRGGAGGSQGRHGLGSPARDGIGPDVRTARAAPPCAPRPLRPRRRSPRPGSSRCGVDDLPSVSMIRRRLRVIHPSARSGTPSGTGLWNSTFIRAVTPQSSLAASDQAMTSSRIVHRIPPWAIPSQPSNRSAQGDLRPGTVRLDVQLEAQPVRVERPAGEAVVRRDLEPAPSRDVDHPDLRRQGSAPCAPRS